MMDYPLTITQFFERSRRLWAKKVLSTRVPGQPLFRYTYADFAARTQRLAGGLTALGMRRGDRVATLAWNSHRHLELYWAIPLMGGVLHTLNFRLAPRDLTYIVNHARDTIVFCDASTWPVLDTIRKDCPSIRTIVVMKDTPEAPVPPGALEYESLLASATPAAAWPQLAETQAAAMCYTSGTTGNPKGVVYTHRAIYLHCLAESMTDTMALSERDVILHIVPMFHANAWCVPFAAVMLGATQIFGGPNPQPRDIAGIVQAEKVTFVGAVPTVWIAVKELVEKEGYDISSIRMIPSGGSAVPPSLMDVFEKKFGASMMHAWGMTEMTPLGTISRLKSYMRDLPDAEQLAIRAKQGYAAAGVDLRVADEHGREAPWDGTTMGEIQVRGPWILKSYYDAPESADRFTPDGWFRTGDLATIDAEGYIQITDRTKDVIKSGGEFMSSVALESLIMGHPDVLEAAVIAVPHPKWIERPLACVVPKAEAKGRLTEGDIIEFLRPQVAKWMLPDEVVFIDAVPKTGVGKFDKKVLRERYKGWQAKDG
ncbi:MAG: long-chain fatty acid--CoA ligase [Candidatus Rokubacteria bacterium]|nr:long-chain fatty acid--CoA ligase [Candidatus Rokubacteria bacterium]